MRNRTARIAACLLTAVILYAVSYQILLSFGSSYPSPAYLQILFAERFRILGLAVLTAACSLLMQRFLGTAFFGGHKMPLLLINCAIIALLSLYTMTANYDFSLGASYSHFALGTLVQSATIFLISTLCCFIFDCLTRAKSGK